MSDLRPAGTAQASGAVATLPEIIAVRGLAKRYATGGEAVVALEGIDFAIAEGEFVAIVGPSGCGKSTLLKILAGLLPTSAGEALLRGSPIAGPRRDIGVVFQAPVLFPWRTVRDNWSASAASRSAIPGSCRAACSSASPSCAPSSTTRPCC